MGVAILSPYDEHMWISLWRAMPATTEPNNPAGRLYALLDKAKTPARPNDTTKVKDRLSTVLGVNKGDIPTLLVRVSNVLMLPSEVRHAISALPDPNIDKSRFLSALPPVEQAFSNLNFDRSVASVCSAHNKGGHGRSWLL